MCLIKTARVKTPHQVISQDILSPRWVCRLLSISSKLRHLVTLMTDWIGETY